MRELGHCTCYQRDRTENLDEEMNSLEIGELVIICVHADTEKQARVSPVNNFVVPELVSRLELCQNAAKEVYLDKVRLILLVSWSDYPVHFPT